MATARYETAAQIVKDAAVLLGLPEVADPFASSDSAQARLCRCLTIAGRALVQVYQWPHLRRVCDITAAAGDGRAWTVPADFAGFIPDTAWNQTQDQWIPGPLDAVTWQEYEATGTTPASPCFRFVQGAFAVIPSGSVTDGDALQYEYHGKSWVMPTGQTVPTEDRATAGTDTVWFPSGLMAAALRRAWLLSNSMDTTTAEPAYWQAIDSAKGAETTAPALPLGQRRTTLYAPRSPTRGWIV